MKKVGLRKFVHDRPFGFDGIIAVTPPSSEPSSIAMEADMAPATSGVDRHADATYAPCQIQLSVGGASIVGDQTACLARFLGRFTRFRTYLSGKFPSIDVSHSLDALQNRMRQIEFACVRLPVICVS